MYHSKTSLCCVTSPLAIYGHLFRVSGGDASLTPFTDSHMPVTAILSKLSRVSLSGTKWRLMYATGAKHVTPANPPKYSGMSMHLYNHAPYLTDALDLSMCTLSAHCLSPWCIFSPLLTGILGGQKQFPWQDAVLRHTSRVSCDIG